MGGGDKHGDTVCITNFSFSFCFPSLSTRLQSMVFHGNQPPGSKSSTRSSIGRRSKKRTHICCPPDLCRGRTSERCFGERRQHIYGQPGRSNSPPSQKTTIR